MLIQSKKKELIKKLFSIDLDSPHVSFKNEKDDVFLSLNTTLGIIEYELKEKPVIRLNQRTINLNQEDIEKINNSTKQLKKECLQRSFLSKFDGNPRENMKRIEELAKKGSNFIFQNQEIFVNEKSIRLQTGESMQIMPAEIVKKRKRRIF